MRKQAEQHLKKLWRDLMPTQEHPWWQRVLRSAAMLFIFGGLAFAGLFLVYLLFLYLTLPRSIIRDIRDGDFSLSESTLIYDREGNLLYSIHGEKNRKVLDNLDEISPHLIDATLSIEDDRFYHHVGIDGPAFVKAVFSEFGFGPARGGSTITQQLVKNSWLTPEHSYKRKIQEVLIALQLELRASKDDILLRYLNTIPYGSNAYGIELAANRYFKKTAAELTIAESAILAAIPKAPTRYSPYGNYKSSVIHFDLTAETLGERKITGEADLEWDEWTRGLIGQSFALPDGSSFYLRGRSDLVLERMLELGKITDEEFEAAKLETQALVFTPFQETIVAPHFVFWVKQMLEEKYGATLVEQGGLKVYTTLDPGFQAAAEKAITDRWATNQNSYGTGNAALVTVQPNTGQILAFVGSAGFFPDEENNKVVVDGQVNMITSRRQPGSSFKPFVYAMAFLNQYSPATVLYDVPTKFGAYTYKNYDGSFRGAMSIREALGQSRNIPAIKAYFLAGGEAAIVPFVQSLGLSIPEGHDYGASLALGGGVDVTPLEMAEAYSVFANGGVRVSTSPILKIETSDGEILEQWDANEVEKEEVLNSEVAYLINSILSDGSVGLGPNVRIESLDNAAKTGTSTKADSNLPSDGWIAAYTPSLATVVWTGNTDGSGMGANADGYMTAAPIWKNYMSSLLDRAEATVWPRPDGIREVAISKATGKLPTADTPSDMVRTEVFASFAVPNEVDDGFKTVKIETVSGRLATEWSPAEVVEEKRFRVHRSVVADLYPAWQAAINAWAAGQEGQEQAPTESAEDIHNATTAANLPQALISSPSSLSFINPDEKSLSVELEILSVGNGIKEVLYELDGRKMDVVTEAPYSGTLRVPVGIPSGTLINLTATTIDIYGYRSVSTISLRMGAEDDNFQESDPSTDLGTESPFRGNWINPIEQVEALRLFKRHKQTRANRDFNHL